MTVSAANLATVFCPHCHIEIVFALPRKLKVLEVDTWDSSFVCPRKGCRAIFRCEIRCLRGPESAGAAVEGGRDAGPK